MLIALESHVSVLDTAEMLDPCNNVLSGTLAQLCIVTETKMNLALQVSVGGIRRWT